jgi:anti-sigma factor RsiW
MTNEHTTREESLDELLPWHAAGTLSRREAERVEAALAGDPELARRYELVREEMAASIHLNETLGAPSPRVMQDLFAKIDAEPRRRRMPLGIGGRIAEFVASLTPRTLAWSGAAAVLAIVLQAGLIAGFAIHNAHAPAYETASAPAASPAKGAFALVRFAPQATAQEIGNFLTANKLSIAAGPTTGDLYRVRIADEQMPRPELAERIRRLQDNAIINFIAPTQ